MSQDNHITLRGYLCAEPILHQKTSAATPITEIRVGSTPRRLNRETGEWYDAPASYYTVKCWRRLAINVASSLHKGDMVVVRGRFYMNSWVDRQQRHQSRIEIEADSLGHDLAYGWSHFLRGTRSHSDRADGVNAGELARQDVGSANPDGQSANLAGENADVLDGEYSADRDLADESDPGEGSFADPSLTGLAVTESDGDHGLEPDGILGASDPADGASRPTAEAVPF